MSLRTSSAGIFLLVVACGGPPDGVTPGNGNGVDRGNGTPAEAPAEHVACAIGGAEYADVCTIDRVAAADGTLLTIRHPDGGFRRLRLSADGRSVTAADGALPAQIIARSDTEIEVAVGDARYRLPLER